MPPEPDKADVCCSSMLAVATRKRLMVFHFQGNEFVEMKDISLPDVHCMQWLGDSICVGTKRECVSLDPCCLLDSE